MTTWYEATTERGPARPPLSGESAADVCVIGGGLAGIVTALELARRGKRVVLLEAERLAWAASGRNGGFVSNGFAERSHEVVKRIGRETARALHRLSAHGTEYLRRAIGDERSIKMGDGILLALRHRDPRGLAAYLDLMRGEFDEELIALAPEETRSRLASARYFDGVLNPRGFHVHPLRLAMHLAGAAEAAGATVHESSRALQVARVGGAYAVRTAAGRVCAPHVVYCVSALDRALHPPTGRAILPVATHVAVTAPMIQRAIAPGPAYADTRRAGDYYRVVDEGRILWGGRITTRVAEPARLAERLRGDMIATFPQLGNAVIAHAWSGIMGYAVHRMPLIGGDGAGQWWATAFGGHGLNTAAMAGQLIARAVADGDDEYRRFAVFAPRWAGGPFGRAAVQASYWWMQLRDKIDERRARSGIDDPPAPPAG